MAGIPRKIKEDLALLYEYPEFKALEKWNQIKRMQLAEQILGTNMDAEGSDKRVAMLQGQALAHGLMLLELKKIHKDTQPKD